MNYCVASDDVTGELWVVIEGSTSLASWQTNLTFQPVAFEDAELDVRVHRGSYDAARLIYDDIRAAVAEHVRAFGARAKIHVTGHSIGGSLAMLLALMLVLRKDAPRERWRTCGRLARLTCSAAGTRCSLGWVSRDGS